MSSIRSIRHAIVVLISVFLPVYQAASAQNTPSKSALLAQAQTQEKLGTLSALDVALGLIQQAYALDPQDVDIEVAEVRIRYEALLVHIQEGDRLLERYLFQDALKQYQLASALGRSNTIAQQDVERVQQILAELKRNPGVDPALLVLTAQQREHKDLLQQFSVAHKTPQLNIPLKTPIPRINVNGQSSGEVFRALGKSTGVRVLFDPDYQGNALGLNQTLDFTGLTIEEALDYVAMSSKSFWRPLSADTIIVAADDPAKRSTFEDQVTKTVYLTNAPTAQETQHIGETVKNITDMKKLIVHPEQNALVLRGEPSRVALAEKLAGDLDKAKAEIIIDVLVLSVSKNWTRDVGLVLGITPNNLAVGFTPGAGAATGAATTATTTTLKNLKHISTGDFSITLPGAAVNALLQDADTKLVDKAQLRIIEGQKSTLRIGQKIPYATGSFAPAAVGAISPLINTQFSFFDVGLNLDVTARVHGLDEVSLHIESDHSAVSDYENVGGGLTQPVITQRKRVADVRIREGEVNLWDVVSERQSVRSYTGIPGLVNLPLIGRLFRNNHANDEEDILVHLLVPHIIRSPDIREVDVTGFSSGSEAVVQLPLRQSAASTVRSESTDAVIDLSGNGVTSPTAQAPSTEPAKPSTTPRVQSSAAPSASLLPLKFNSPNVTAPASSQFTIEINTDDALRLGAGTFGVRFDAAAVKFIGAVAGSVLGGDDGTPGELQVQEQGGQLSVTLRKSGASTASAGTLAKLTFEASRPGASTIQIVDARLRDSKGTDVPASGDQTTIQVQ